MLNKMKFLVVSAYYEDGEVDLKEYKSEKDLIDGINKYYFQFYDENREKFEISATKRKKLTEEQIDELTKKMQKSKYKKIFFSKSEKLQRYINEYLSDSDREKLLHEIIDDTIELGQFIIEDESGWGWKYVIATNEYMVFPL